MIIPALLSLLLLVPCVYSNFCEFFFFFQAEDGIRDAQESRGLGDVYKRQVSTQSTGDEDDMEFFDDIEYKKKQAEEQRKAEEAVEISSFRDALSKKVVTKPKAIQAKPKEPEPAKPKPTKRRLLVVRGGKNKAAKTAQDAGAEPETNQPAPENKAEEPGGLGGLLGADYGSDSD
eukprot:TRINITY_DN10258_c0_g2_i1.p1 TRINITY_DN10258_c0_g2~~TRINITY_DN10258_c0_g2_i1.p1  ORF type:complete len:175 (-),score=69.27 TRINITY_DN10258_c0_g2_i1:350-874(-)